MTKKLKVDDITSELQGSVFFPARQQASPTQDMLGAEQPEPVTDHAESQPSAPVPERKRQTSGRRSPRPNASDSDASELAGLLASTQAIFSDSQIDRIRKIVKVPGKEVSYVRLTSQEKDELADILYTYKRRGTKTTENEITRIAVNYLVADYKENGEASVLARVIEALRA
jgi:hypothetical protein